MQALGLIWDAVDGRAPDAHERVRALAAPRHPDAKFLLDFWRRRNGEDGVVVGIDVPSRALSRMLRNLAVYEPVGGGQDFRVRLAGTAFLRGFGRDITGARLSELLERPAFERERRAMHEALLRDAPVMHDVERGQGWRRRAAYEALLLPVWAPDGASRWLLSGLFFHDWAG